MDSVGEGVLEKLPLLHAVLEKERRGEALGEAQWEAVVNALPDARSLREAERVAEAQAVREAEAEGEREGGAEMEGERVVEGEGAPEPLRGGLRDTVPLALGDRVAVLHAVRLRLPHAEADAEAHAESLRLVVPLAVPPARDAVLQAEAVRKALREAELDPVPQGEPLRDGVAVLLWLPVLQGEALRVAEGHEVGERLGELLRVCEAEVLGVSDTLPDVDAQNEGEGVADAERQGVGLLLALRELRVVAVVHRLPLGVVVEVPHTVGEEEEKRDRVTVGDGDSVVNALTLTVTVGDWDSVVDALPLTVTVGDELRVAAELAVPVELLVEEGVARGDAVPVALPVELEVADALACRRRRNAAFSLQMGVQRRSTIIRGRAAIRAARSGGHQALVARSGEAPTILCVQKHHKVIGPCTQPNSDISAPPHIGWLFN